MQSGFPGLQLGSFNLAYFGVIVLIAAAASGLTSWLEARRYGQDADAVIDVVATAFILSLVIGRFFYIWSPPPSVAALYSREWYLMHWSDLLVGPLAIWSGGLGSAGLLLGAMLGVALVVWRRHLEVLMWADILAPGALVFLVIAPWSNLVNQQLLGPPTTLPWGVLVSHRVPPLDDLARYPTGTVFHPTPAYVSLWAAVALMATLTLFQVLKWKDAPGNRFIFSGLLMLPGLFLADTLRIDVSRPLLDLSGMQSLSLALFIAFGILAFLRLRAPGPLHRTRASVPKNS